MAIIIDIILFLLAVALAILLGNITQKTDDSIIDEIVESGNKYRNRSHHPVHTMLRDLRHER